MGRSKVNSYRIEGDAGLDNQIAEALKLLDLKEGNPAFKELAIGSLKRNEPPKVYLQRLLEAILSAKEDARIIRWIQQAKFNSVHTLEEFDFTAQPELQRLYEREIRDLASCDFIKDGHNVLLIGPSGIGKTHLSVAMGIKAIEHGHSVRFIELKDLVAVVRRMEDSRDSFQRVLRSFVNPDLFILDDVLFYETDEATASFLHKIIFSRYNDRKSTIVSSNFGIQDWKSLFLTPERAATVVDRLTHKGSTFIYLENGVSYRTGVKQGLAGINEN
jgi:DNA replication protein DnaC